MPIFLSRYSKILSGILLSGEKGGEQEYADNLEK